MCGVLGFCKREYSNNFFLCYNTSIHVQRLNIVLSSIKIQKLSHYISRYLQKNPQIMNITLFAFDKLSQGSVSHDYLRPVFPRFEISAIGGDRKEGRGYTPISELLADQITSHAGLAEDDASQNLFSPLDSLVCVDA